MGKYKHTSGPWKPYEFTIKITDTLMQVGISHGDFPNGHEIGSAYGRSDEEAFANAKLIAAAPELLSVCFKILADDIENAILKGPDRAKLKAAINKATL